MNEIAKRINGIAKNLLQDKTCGNCNFANIYNPNRCDINDKISNRPITCVCWLPSNGVDWPTYDKIVKKLRGEGY